MSFPKPPKKSNYLVILITLLFSSYSGWKISANPRSANPMNQTSNVLVAQASQSLCRQVNTEQGLAVRAQPNPNSSQIGGVEANQQVFLTETANKITGPAGRLWVEIVSPINGYVAAGYPNSETNLIDCQETAVNLPENMTNEIATNEIAMVNLCRRVGGEIASEGLGIYSDASRLSAYRGGLPPGGRVMLAPNYQLIPDKNGYPVNWVQIMEPTPGFITAEPLLMCDDVGRSLPANTPISSSSTPAATNPTANSTANSTASQLNPQLNPQLCRRVEGRVAPNGLAIRADASSSSAYLGGVEAGGDVYLVANYQEIPDRNNPSRKWLEITAPTPGFISAGNLIMCQ